MKERPLLMSAEMVKADRAGRKSQTRRTAGLDRINLEPDNWQMRHTLTQRQVFTACFWYMGGGVLDVKCPYGQVGDRLWIRESWAVNSQFDEIAPKFLDPDECKIWYAADVLPSFAGKTRASIHMPREFSRRTVEITGLDCQRVQDISENDAISEGTVCLSLGWLYKNFPDYEKAHLQWVETKAGITKPPLGPSPKQRFLKLFASLNKSAQPNPWVWVITYKPVN